MTYEARTSGSHVLKCDAGMCQNELLAPNQDQLFEDANLCGWVEVNGKHVCIDCTRGSNLAQAMTRALGSPMTIAPADVRAGDPVYDDNGKQVATYKNDAKQGDHVYVEIYVPVQTQVSVSERYAEILGIAPAPGASVPDPFEGFGDPSPAGDPTMAQIMGKVRSPVDGPSDAPRQVSIDELFEDAPQKAPSSPQAPSRAGAYPDAKPGSKRTLTAPSGTAGGVGLVKAPERPSREEVKQLQKPQRKVPTHGIRVEKLNETSELFGFLDGGSEKTRWKPDGK